jgi:hypothetical protein
VDPGARNVATKTLIDDGQPVRQQIVVFHCPYGSPYGGS